uniref:Secreted protein n=1 Tax=Panstrongylus lignarius TaxID=156445 RepID=A0A224Y6Y0_9HEMI
MTSSLSIFTEAALLTFIVSHCRTLRNVPAPSRTSPTGLRTLISISKLKILMSIVEVEYLNRKAIKTQ